MSTIAAIQLMFPDLPGTMYKGILVKLLAELLYRNIISREKS